MGVGARREMLDAIVRACLIDAEHYYHQGYFGRVCYFALKGWWRSPGEWRFPFWMAKAGLKKLWQSAISRTWVVLEKEHHQIDSAPDRS